MGLFDFMKMSVDLQLAHNVVFPGNILSGVCNLNVTGNIEFVGIRLIARGQEYVKVAYDEQERDHEGNYRTVTRYTDNTTVIYEQVMTIAGAMKCSGSRQKIDVAPGNYQYPFCLQLPTNLPPSMYSDKERCDVAIRYTLECEVDVPTGLDKSKTVPFTVLSAIPASQHQMPSGRNERRNIDVTCCCCISKGTIDAQLAMSKTVVALDQDTIEVQFNVDNSKGEEPVDAIHVRVLNKIEGRVMGRTNTSQTTIAHTKLPQRVEAGGTGTFTGSVQLRPLSNPTCSSLNVVSTCILNVELDIPWATDPSIDFPLVVSSSVDQTNYLPPKDFGGYYNFQPMIMSEVFYAPPPPQFYTGQNMIQPVQMNIPTPQGANVWAPPTQYYQQEPNYQFFQ